MKKLLCILVAIVVYIAMGLVMEQFAPKSELLSLLYGVMFIIPLIFAMIVAATCILAAMILWPLIPVGVGVGVMAVWDWLQPSHVVKRHPRCLNGHRR